MLGLSLIPKGAPARWITPPRSALSTKPRAHPSESDMELTVQARITDHFYVDLSALLRRIGLSVDHHHVDHHDRGVEWYQLSHPPALPARMRTRGPRLIDIPLLVRYYGTGKRPGSPRWFLEAGRNVASGELISALRSIPPTLRVSSLAARLRRLYRSIAPRNRVGRRAPECNSWMSSASTWCRKSATRAGMDSIFDNLTTSTQRNQVEAIFR